MQAVAEEHDQQVTDPHDSLALQVFAGDEIRIKSGSQPTEDPGSASGGQEKTHNGGFFGSCCWI